MSPHSTIRDQVHPDARVREPSHLSDSPCGAAPSFGRPLEALAGLTRTDTAAG